MTDRSRGISDVEEDFGIIFFNDFCRLGLGGQISPNSDVILSIIDWSIGFDSTIFSIRNEEKCDGADDGGVRRLTIGIDVFDRIGDIDVDCGEWGGVGTNGHVDNVRLIVSRRMIVGENDEHVVVIDGDEHKQWPNDVIVFIIVKRRGIYDEVDVDRSFKRIESSNNWSFLS